MIRVRLGPGEGVVLSSIPSPSPRAAAKPWRRSLLIIFACAVALLVADLSGISQLAMQRPQYTLEGSSGGKARLLNLLRFRHVEALRSTFRYERAHMRWRPRPALFRGAPWRALVGSWMAECHGAQQAVPVRETFFAKDCPGGCAGALGVCNYETGQCMCRRGYNGSDCGNLRDNPCNMPPMANFPFGGFVQSTCPAFCDLRLAHCLCGPSSPYPNRPVVAPCGFPFNDKGALEIDRLDQEQLYARDEASPGWCMADPAQVKAGVQRLARECYNSYDGAFGLFSETPVRAFCIGQCTSPDHGTCHNGACVCEEGWYGVDCSTPSASAVAAGSAVVPTPWLPALRPEDVRQPGSREPAEATRQQKRPLVYVYDLPRRYTAGLIEGRQLKYKCATRLYDPNNHTDFNIGWDYGSEMLLYESFLASPHRTNNPEEADYFFVPLLGACLMAEADDNPDLSLKTYGTEPTSWVRPNLMLHWAQEVYLHLRKEFPYWDRNLGRDHIWMFLSEEGACYAPEAIGSSVMLTHWGNTESVHQGCVSSFPGDQCSAMPRGLRGEHPCYSPLKDIVVPARKVPYFLTTHLRRRTFDQRPLLFFFRGNLGSTFEHGRQEARFSMGIRQRLAHYFSSTPNSRGQLGVLAEQGVVVEHGESLEQYNEKLASAKFCGVFPGDGFTSRMEDSMLQGCIPVIIQDGVELPFENVLDYEAFAIRISERNIPYMVNILMSVPEKRVRQMLATLQSVLGRWFYRSALELTAAQERRERGTRPDWAAPLSDLEGDDAFDTIIQVLHYKLYHDSWRRNKDEVHQRTTGMPEQCSS